MNDEEILAAFVDDERVDPEALKAALATPEGREYLIDLLALRELVADRTSAAGAPVASSGRATRMRTWVAAAAVLICLGGLGGYRIARRLHPAAAPALLQPIESPRPAGSGSAGLVPPAPTRIIRLEAGKDWHEFAGSH
jgi:hypothetical protein